MSWHACLKKGIQNYMVDIGGEIVAKGKNSRNGLWRIGINKPIDDSLSVNQEIQTILELSDAGLATSGNYRNFYYKDGKSMHTPLIREQDIRYNTISFPLPSLPKIA